MTGLTLAPIAATEAGFTAALTEAGLPVDDLAEAGRTFFAIRRNAQTLGYGGFELHGDKALLRSQVIVPAARGTGVGREATGLLLDQAFSAGARSGYLLTESAAPFFARAGFVPLDRASAPAAILATRQASSLCPSTAALLARPITRANRV